MNLQELDEVFKYSHEAGEPSIALNFPVARLAYYKRKLGTRVIELEKRIPLNGEHIWNWITLIEEAAYLQSMIDENLAIYLS